MKQLLIVAFFVSGGYIARSQEMQEAKTLMYHERYRSASELLKNTIEKDPRNTEAWYLLTRCYLKNDKVESSGDSLPAVPADLDHSAYIECAKGDFLLRHGKKDSAGALFNDALGQTRQKDAAILKAVAIAHIRSDSGDGYYALELLSRAIKLDKKNPSLYVEQGNAYRKLQNGGEAYKAYSGAFGVDKSYAEAYYRLGKLFATQNNPLMYLKYYHQALAADSAYAPAWYSLYYYYYFNDPVQAMGYLNKYIFVSDSDPANSYRKADLLYLTKNYSDAIREADLLESGRRVSVDPRLYKLQAYSYDELHDSIRAIDKMRIYFKEQPDCLLIAKDFESMAKMYGRFKGKEDSAADYLERAIVVEKDSAEKLSIYRDMADLYKKEGDFKKQSLWLGRYYQSNSRAGNVDLFNWGIASYLAKDYSGADSVFTLYTVKYPAQTFGFYWKARSDIVLDSNMEIGMAVQPYKEVIRLSTVETGTPPNNKWLVEAFGYLAAYEANTQKNYPEATRYLEKLLVLDPENTGAKKYIEVLKKNSARSAVSKN